MSFDSNKQDLLKRISQNKRDANMQRRNDDAKSRLFEAERKKDLGGPAVTPAMKVAAVNAPEKTQKPPIAIFGAKGLFISTLKDALQQYCEVNEFSEIDKATDFLFTNPVPVALMDMDAPNDWRDAHDFFTTGKTMNPSMRYIIYHKDEKMPEPIEILHKQGATVFKKPIDRLDLIERVKDFTLQWREQNAKNLADKTDSGVS